MKSNHLSLTMRELTETETVNRAKELATPISDFIGPSEIEEHADSWEEIDTDVLNQELHEMTEIVISEAHYGHPKIASVLYDRAITVLKNDMMRVPMSDMDLSEEKAIKKGYWPYQMSHGEVFCKLQEEYTVITDIPSEFYRKAYEEVSRGLIEGSKPQNND